MHKLAKVKANELILMIFKALPIHNRQSFFFGLFTDDERNQNPSAEAQWTGDSEKAEFNNRHIEAEYMWYLKVRSKLHRALLTVTYFYLEVTMRLWDEELTKILFLD
jgi:hypothetical protein